MDGSKTATDLNNLFRTWSSAGPCQNAQVTFTVPNTSYALTTEFLIPSSNWTLDASRTPGVSITQTTNRQRLFNVYNSVLTATGLTFTDGSVVDSSRGGGCILGTASDVTFSSCLFRNCSSSGIGGAVSFLSGSQALLINVTFENNAAGYGGSVSASGATFVATNCNFLASTARTRGGAMDFSSMKSVAIIQCSFQNCRAGFTGGGALYFSNGGWPATIAESIFANNSCTAGSGAGAIQVASSSSQLNLTIASSAFTGNLANNVRSDVVSRQSGNILFSCLDTCALTSPLNLCQGVCPGK